MCSVVGYIGKNLSKQFILEGLARLEYRGYDSAGFACLNTTTNKIDCVKTTGSLENLHNSLATTAINGFVGLGHTRWATHGLQSVDNAHPHFDCHQTIGVVHNGIIENHHQLRVQLQEQGHHFISQTDTEVIAHLLEQEFIIYQDFYQAMLQMVKRLEGAYAFIALMQEQPNTLIVVRKRSPVCIGIGNGEMFIASDILAFAGRTKQVVFLPDETIAFVTDNKITLYDFEGNPVAVTIQTLSPHWFDNHRNGHAHYMLKEIFEQKKAIHDTVEYLELLGESVFQQMGLVPEQLKNLARIKLVGCGTSWHAGRIGQFFFESVCKIPVHVYLASEFRYMPFFPEQDCLYMALSQSGETADTLEALRLINNIQLPTLALTNVESSTMVREAKGYLLTQAGPEIAVASTKAFSTQLAAMYWLAHRIALEQHLIDQAAMQQACNDLITTAQILEDTIELYKYDIITKHAKTYAAYKRAIFLGRHISYPFALEAALKLKEIAYIFSQCYPAGELKHGPLALIDSDTPLFVFSLPDSLLYQKLLSNVQVAKARGSHIVAFAFEGQDELFQMADLCFIIPTTSLLLAPLAMTGLMQFFVYAIANELQHSIDKPRHLAKSVTVE